MYLMVTYVLVFSHATTMYLSMVITIQRTLRSAIDLYGPLWSRMANKWKTIWYCWNNTDIGVNSNPTLVRDSIHGFMTY